MHLRSNHIAALVIFALPIHRLAAADEPATSARPATGKWESIFNGQDLDGWTVKIKGYDVGENYADTFRVEDGKLVVRFDKYEGPYRGRFGHLFFNERLSNYVLRLEYRFVGEQAPGGPAWATRNSGVMIHGQTPESMQRDQDFPVSLEVQLLAGDGENPRPTGNLCTPGTNVVYQGQLHTPHCTNSSSDTYIQDEWVSCEIEVHGGKILRHKINGKTVIEYSEPQLDERDEYAKGLLADGAEKMLAGGTISLQAESHPVEFRKVELMRLEE